MVKKDADSCSVDNGMGKCGENDVETSDPNDTPSRGDHERLDDVVHCKVDPVWPLGQKNDIVAPMHEKEDIELGLAARLTPKYEE